MYNYFLIIGSVESITNNTINLDVQGEHLEVIVDFEMPENIEKGNVITVKGHIKTNGLYADKIVMTCKEL